MMKKRLLVLLCITLLISMVMVNHGFSQENHKSDRQKLTFQGVPDDAALDSNILVIYLRQERLNYYLYINPRYNVVVYGDPKEMADNDFSTDKNAVY